VIPLHQLRHRADPDPQPAQPVAILSPRVRRVEQCLGDGLAEADA